jgi:hypothetical protein
VHHGVVGVACGLAGEALARVRYLQAVAHAASGDPEEAFLFACEARREIASARPLAFAAGAEAAEAAHGANDLTAVRTIASEVHAAWLAQAGAPSPSAFGAAARVATASFLAGAVAEANELLGAIEATSRDAAAVEAAVNATSADRGHLAAARAARALVRGDAEDEAVNALVAAAAFEEAGDLRRACVHACNAGHLLTAFGRFTEAARVLERARGAASRLRLERELLVTTAHLAHARARSGALAEARELARAAADGFAERGDASSAMFPRVVLGAVLGATGDAAAALRELGAAVASTRAGHPLVATALAVRALVELGRGRAREAHRAALEAMRALEGRENVETEPLVRLAHAESLAATGQPDAARAAVDAAHKRLLARAERVKNDDWRRAMLESVVENARILSRARSWSRRN